MYGGGARPPFVNSRRYRMKGPLRLTEWLLVGCAMTALSGLALRIGLESEAKFSVSDLLLASAAMVGGVAAISLRGGSRNVLKDEHSLRQSLELACDATLVIGPDRHISSLSTRAAALF